MKYDIDYSTPYFQELFSTKTENDLTYGIDEMNFLSLYHKKQHYDLYTSCKNDIPNSWVETDNIFSSNAPVNPLTHIEWAAKVYHFDAKNDMGDILEFGVAAGRSIRDIAFINPNKKVYGFDHFQGLEKTNQYTPDYAGWYEGAFKLGTGGYSRPFEMLIDDLSQFYNINLIVEDIHQLKPPLKYDIFKICAVHIDVDIYEPTVSALEFVDKCEWDKLYIRFDDWHGHEPDYDYHERLACKEWIDKNKYNFELLRNGYHGELIIYR